MAPERIKVEPKLIGGEPLVVTNRMSEIVVSGGFRIFLANRLIALGWALKGCKPCAHGLFGTARWLVPEARRFLVSAHRAHTLAIGCYLADTPFTARKRAAVSGKGVPKSSTIPRVNRPSVARASAP